MQTLTEQLQKGSMIKTVSNSNGTATKLPDGTMICKKTITFSNIAIAQKVGEVYQSAAQNLGNWAENFLETPDTVVATVNGGWAAWIYQHANWNATSAGRATLMRPTSVAASADASYRISVIATGKWK